MTPRQKTIYDFIVRHLTEELCPPTVREIAQQDGHALNAVAGHLHCLVRDGRLRKAKGRHCYVPVGQRFVLETS